MPKVTSVAQGVYEKNPGSGIWYIRYRMDGKLVRKRIGKRQAAVEYQRKVGYLRAAEDGHVPRTARGAAKSTKEMTQQAATPVGITIDELCDDLLAYIRSRPDEYRDQKNPPARIEQIRLAFGTRLADSIRPFEISDWLDSLTKRTPGRRNGAKG